MLKIVEDLQTPALQAELKGFESVKDMLRDHAPRVLDSAEEGGRAGLLMEMAGVDRSKFGDQGKFHFFSRVRRHF